MPVHIQTPDFLREALTLTRIVGKNRRQIGRVVEMLLETQNSDAISQINSRITANSGTTAREYCHLLSVVTSVFWKPPYGGQSDIPPLSESFIVVRRPELRLINLLPAYSESSAIVHLLVLSLEWKATRNAYKWRGRRNKQRLGQVGYIQERNGGYTDGRGQWD